MHSRSTRIGLYILFVSIFVVMLIFTIRASLVRSVFNNGHLLGDEWFQATLADAYLGFIVFFVWVAWRERSFGSRFVWFVLIMTLGNIAMAGYILIQLYRLPETADFADLLTKHSGQSEEVIS